MAALRLCQRVVGGLEKPVVLRTHDRNTLIILTVSDFDARRAFLAQVHAHRKTLKRPPAKHLGSLPRVQKRRFF